MSEEILEKKLDFLLPIEKSYESEGKWIVEGIVSTTEIDSDKFRMSKAALDDLIGDTKVLSTVLHNHKSDEEIGVVLEGKVILLSKEPEIWGAWVKILISKTVPKIWQKIREGVLSKFSIKGTADARTYQDSKKGIITEATSYHGAELSIVSVPVQESTRVLNYYIEKMRKGGLPMEVKDLQKINLDSAKAAIKDLFGEEGAEKWTEVEKILNLIEIEKAEPGEQLSEEDIEKDWKSKMAAITNSLKQLKEKVDDELKKSVDDIIASVEAALSAYPKSPAPAKKDEGSEEEEAEKAKVEAEKAKVEAEKARTVAEAATALQTLETQVSKLSDPEKVVFKPILDQLRQLATPVEKSKVDPDSKEKGSVAKITSQLAEVEKSVKDAASRIESDQIVKMAETVVELQKEVVKLSGVVTTQIPLRKGLVPDPEPRPAEEKNFTEDKEYQAMNPRDRLGFLFGGAKKDS